MKRAISAAVLALVLHSGAARADDEAAATAAFDRAVELYRAKKYREAAESFDRARIHAPRGPVAYNGARAWKSANEPTLAADDFAIALELGGLSETQKKDATEQLKALDASLGVLDLEGPPGAHARVGDVDHKLPAQAHIVPGAYKVFFTSGATTEEKSGSVARGERVAIAWQPAPPKPVAIAPAPPVAPPPPSPAEPPRDPYRARRVLSIATIVVGSGVLIGGLYEGIDGMNTRDRFVEGGQHDRILHDRAEEQRTWANVLGIGGLAVIGVGVYFLITTPKSDVAAASLRLTPNGVAFAGALP